MGMNEQIRAAQRMQEIWEGYWADEYSDQDSPILFELMSLITEFIKE